MDLQCVRSDYCASHTHICALSEALPVTILYWALGRRNEQLEEEKNLCSLYGLFPFPVYQTTAAELQVTLPGVFRPSACPDSARSSPKGENDFRKKMCSGGSGLDQYYYQDPPPPAPLLFFSFSSWCCWLRASFLHGQWENAIRKNAEWCKSCSEPDSYNHTLIFLVPFSSISFSPSILSLVFVVFYPGNWGQFSGESRLEQSCATYSVCI